MKSKRFEVLANRPVNQDGYVKEWPEVGLIAMNSPFDPTWPKDRGLQQC